MTQKEAQARIKINKLLEESGWHFEDSGKNKANIQLEAIFTLIKQSYDFE